MFEKITEMLDSFIGNGTPGYDIAIYRNGECLFRRTEGYSDSENKIKMNGKELYYVYSCSKMITATAAMQLYERGLFDLDDRVEKYIPEFSTMYVKCEDGSTREAKTPITVRHLLTMTAGFSYVFLNNPGIKKFREETGGRCPTRDFAKYVAAETALEFEPGTRWNYSLCHDILGSLIEIWSGEKFGEYLKKNIFEPSGMTDTSFYIPPEEYHRLCAQYRYDFGTKTIARVEPTNCYDLGPEFESGGAGCVSTVDDMIKFGEALRTGKLLREETLDLMSTSQIAHCQDTFWVEKYSYGLGVRCSKGGDGITDIGWGGAAGAGLWVDRTLGLTVYYAQHVLNSPIVKRRNELIFLIKEDLGLGEASEALKEDTATEKDKMRSNWGV
ncbi:MAG: beta-lactamase family protein [Ruminococcaceae bacterium]|nr:beta-lactamase family protein [Oscillospiraceae bacterium]